MKKYIGVKQIIAEPQVKLGAPADKETQSELGDGPFEIEGYKVIYEDGYESWSPKDVFEKAYIETGVGVVLGKPLKEHELRVQNEYFDLTDRLSKLRLALPKLKEQGVDTEDLEQQSLIMQAYSDILVKRLNSFGA